MRRRVGIAVLALLVVSLGLIVFRPSLLAGEPPPALPNWIWLPLEPQPGEPVRLAPDGEPLEGVTYLQTVGGHVRVARTLREGNGLFARLLAGPEVEVMPYESRQVRSERTRSVNGRSWRLYNRVDMER
jgi:hypothetical protein